MVPQMAIYSIYTTTTVYIVLLYMAIYATIYMDIYGCIYIKNLFAKTDNLC